MLALLTRPRYLAVRITCSSAGESIAPVGLAGDERIKPLIGGRLAAARAAWEGKGWVVVVGVVVCGRCVVGVVVWWWWWRR